MQEARAGRRGRDGRSGGAAVVALRVALALPVLWGLPAAATAQTPPPSGAMIERALESRTKGGEDAGVVIFEIADFQCPYCATFARTVAPEIDAKYVETGKVQWVFVNLPLHTHPLAWLAAEAALCAGAAGEKFWPMHDRLFAEQDSWGRAQDPAAWFARTASELGVPMDDYRQCVAQDQVASLILQDLGSALSAGISGTPTFIVMQGQKMVEQIVGVRSIEDWSRILDPLMN